MTCHYLTFALCNFPLASQFQVAGKLTVTANHTMFLVFTEYSPSCQQDKCVWYSLGQRGSKSFFYILKLDFKLTDQPFGLATLLGQFSNTPCKHHLNFICINVHKNSNDAFMHSSFNRVASRRAEQDMETSPHSRKHRARVHTGCKFSMYSVVMEYSFIFMRQAT